MPRRQEQTANRTDTHRAQKNNVSMFYYTDIRQRTDLPHGVRHGRSGSNKRKADRPCEGISQNLILFPLIGRRAPAERKAAPEKRRWTRRAEPHGGRATGQATASREKTRCIIPPSPPGAFRCCVPYRFPTGATAGTRQQRISPFIFVGTENSLQNPACWGTSNIGREA